MGQELATQGGDSILVWECSGRDELGFDLPCGREYCFSSITIWRGDRLQLGYKGALFLLVNCKITVFDCRQKPSSELCQALNPVHPSHN